jgi:hypothetical protein
MPKQPHWALTDLMPEESTDLMPEASVALAADLWTIYTHFFCNMHLRKY